MRMLRKNNENTDDDLNDINAVDRYCALISSDAEIDNAVIVVVNSDVMNNRDEIEAVETHQVTSAAVNYHDASSHNVLKNFQAEVRSDKGVHDGWRTNSGTQRKNPSDSTTTVRKAGVVLP